MRALFLSPFRLLRGGGRRRLKHKYVLCLVLMDSAILLPHQVPGRSEQACVCTCVHTRVTCVCCLGDDRVFCVLPGSLDSESAGREACLT